MYCHKMEIWTDLVFALMNLKYPPRLSSKVKGHFSELGHFAVL